ncbi:MaoC/PaaZ C-terminal domain-containing protein [Spongiactinospora sp. TRM90649]|uniref:MaoC/PaaZ C-terminal domain-containing protein n=1 Tax=Spongiactinospora sp. TRM90649 TaxID=3031114 RepID=UPI0023F8FBCA|nr:MaoC/PaaZ C-terminal domain-containing protein [Spongiactinospora sp. TRM90649]MDF5752154.1 MaoC/PaaZ C-terminal domain-containing protein [Spongiactinospora sp. TRM90649]
MRAATGIEWVAGVALPDLAVAPVSRTTLAKYAGASGDYNPMHVDIDAARAAGAADVFAHGMLSMAYLGRLLTRWFPQRDLRSLRVRFRAITPVHARPVCSGRVAAIEDGPERLARVELSVAVQDGTVTVAGEALVAVPAGERAVVR